MGNEVLNAIINFCFTEMGFKSIIAEVDPNNQPSIVILEKNSFSLIEQKKNDFEINNHYYDTHVYERTNSFV